jgi:hypothetical protein
LSSTSIKVQVEVTQTHKDLGNTEPFRSPIFEVFFPDSLIFMILKLKLFKAQTNRVNRKEKFV